MQREASRSRLRAETRRRLGCARWTVLLQRRRDGRSGQLCLNLEAGQADAVHDLKVVAVAEQPGQRHAGKAAARLPDELAPRPTAEVPVHDRPQSR